MASAAFFIIHNAKQGAEAAAAVSNSRILNTSMSAMAAEGSVAVSGSTVNLTTGGTSPTTIAFDTPLPTEAEGEMALSQMGVSNYTEHLASDTTSPYPSTSVIWLTAVASGNNPSATWEAGTVADFQSSGSPVAYMFTGSVVPITANFASSNNRQYDIALVTVPGGSNGPTNPGGGVTPTPTTGGGVTPTPTSSPTPTPTPTHNPTPTPTGTTPTPTIPVVTTPTSVTVVTTNNNGGGGGEVVR